jgi:two-component system sensor histidine kinase YesM
MKRVRKRLMLTVCAMVLPLAVTLIIYNIYSMTALNRQAAQSAAGTGYIYEQFYEKDIKTVESYMISEMVGNDFRRLNYPLESLQAYLCGQSILEDFTKYLTSDVDGLVALEFYSESNDLVRIKHATGTRYEQTKQSRIRRAVYEEMKQGELNNDWYVIPVGDDYFLIRILKYGSVYVGAVMDFDQFMKPSAEDGGSTSYATQDGQALNQENLLEEKQIDLKQNSKGYYITGKGMERYLVVYEQLPYGDLLQYYISPYGSFWSYMGALQWFLLFCSFIFILLIPILYFYMYRFFVAPLEGLKATMEEIAEGDLNAHAEENSDVEEFRLMATTFNHMMDQIQKLKIDAYEQERRIQNATIQYLQIQIRPHFFLNCLKNFYALAEQKEYRSIQELTLALSSYLRKVIAYEEDTISVRKEMESVESYLKLSQLGLSVPVNYSIAVDEKLEEFQILPLSVLTFVENAVKYGVQSQKTLLISIRVSLLPGETPEDTYVCITILDNGPGFPEDVLHVLNKGEFAEEKSSGIGIQNVWKRMKIRYEEKATILYSNSNGACVEMYLPYGKDECINSR